ncbi:MCE family protein [Sphaerisporangium fuscum]|uniref:MCE family protein n=1 Tax=Sphaerisporangium fuscum TaxID=2835868 RepID=UPI001BDC56A0|nr:MCE family protein [Sphaerisporangium fuscum]
MRRLVAAAAVALLPLATAGCSAPAGGPAPYRLVAYFPAAPSLYEQAEVTVMGLPAGSVDRVRIEGGHVRVEMTIDGQVPLPADVRAVVAPRTTLGERDVVLYPPWRPGKARAAAGTVIPEERTDLPVEVDDALEAFTKLTDALDPRRTRAFAGNLAGGLRGRGGDLNRALSATAGLTRTLAAQDDELVRLAGGLDRLATSLNRREGQVKRTIDAFAAASSTLAGERARVRAFVRGVAGFVRRGEVLVAAYQERLPRGVAALAEVVLTLKADSESVARAIEASSRWADVMLDSWDKEHHVMKIRIVLDAMVRAWLTPLFDSLGLGAVPCLPAGLSDCRRRRGGDR